jgi:hypothetical protein
MMAGPIVPAAWAACVALVERASLALPHLAAPGAIGAAGAASPGYRVFWARGEDLAFADVTPGGHLVVGRHARCDVRLEHPAIALRHCVLRARGVEHGTLALEALDLGAELPFHVGPSVFPLRAFSASGPVVFRVADAILVALPFAGCLRPDQSGLRQKVLEVLDADPARARLIPTDPAELAERTLAARGMMEATYRTMARPIERSLPVEILGAARGPVWARVALRGRGGRVVMELSRAQLETLVLVGRYPRCQRGELSPFSELVSRVHAGLLAVDDTIEVIDLASTNGLSQASGAGERAGEGTPTARTIRVRSRASIALGAQDDRLDVEILSP